MYLKLLRKIFWWSCVISIGSIMTYKNIKLMILCFRKRNKNV